MKKFILEWPEEGSEKPGQLITDDLMTLAVALHTANGISESPDTDKIRLIIRWKDEDKVGHETDFPGPITAIHETLLMAMAELKEVPDQEDDSTEASRKMAQCIQS